jgi:acyl-CoA synthetase (AMP-forming)/AMP-acid ligase II
MPATIINQLMIHVARDPEKIAIRYLDRGEHPVDALSYGELHHAVQGMASFLLDAGYAGANIILLFSHPLEFIQAFMACLAAGATAVPVAVPSLKGLDALVNIVRNSQACCVLAGERETEQLQEPLIASAGLLAWHTWSELNATASAGTGRHLTDVRADDLAFLQYTSGSTGMPKGVMVSHANLMANSATINKAMKFSRDSVVVSWLPHYHDMGLIGGLLQPLYSGSECVLMRPIDFIQKPVRWLRAVSNFKATVSGGPNFAFDLCVDKTNEESRDGLDLSTWDIAFCGAEPVKAATMRRFANAFYPQGLKPGAIYPCYGMAETTLFASGPDAGAGPLVLDCDDNSLTTGMSIDLLAPALPGSTPFVACGAPDDDMEVRIVHPETRMALPLGHVGEIWIRGGSVAQGYYRNPEATAHAFRAKLADGSSEHYLRTGDLGALRNGQLVILGRLKDVLIVRGRNYYPQDIEATAEASHEALMAGGGAVFQRPFFSSDQLVLVHEVKREFVRDGDFDEISGAIRSEITEKHGVTPARIVLIRPGQLPRTTSGKVRRSLCRDLLEKGELAALGAEPQQAVPMGALLQNRRTAAELS